MISYTLIYRVSSLNLPSPVQKLPGGTVYQGIFSDEAARPPTDHQLIRFENARQTSWAERDHRSWLNPRHE